MADRFHLFLVPMKAAHGEFVKYDELVSVQQERDAVWQDLSETESMLCSEREWHKYVSEQLDETRDDRNKAWADLSKMERSRDFWCKVSVVFVIATAFLSFWIKVTS